MQIIDPQKVLRIQSNLFRWYMKNYRPLPFREDADPYRIWISEVMLQQTQVRTVLPFYENFTRLFPTVQALAESDIEKVLKAWEGLGYYARARNLHRTAKELIMSHNGTLPSTREALLQLPGIGSYIAAAILSIAFDKPYAVVDGNVKRVYARLFLMDAPINLGKSMKYFQSVSDQLLDASRPGIFNQAVMELGALVCTPLHPKCDCCPVFDDCVAFHTRSTDLYPKKIEKKKVPLIRSISALILDQDRLLVIRRKKEGLLGGLWEVPNYEIHERRYCLPDLKAKVLENLGISIDIRKLIGKVSHSYTHFKTELELYGCDYITGDVLPKEASGFSWIIPDEIAGLPFSKINHKLFPLIREYMNRCRE